MDIDPNNFTMKSAAAFITTMEPRAGIHPIDSFTPRSRVHILSKLKHFLEHMKWHDGNPWPMQMPQHLQDSLDEAEKLVAEGHGDEGGEELQERVGDW